MLHLRVNVSFTTVTNMITGTTVDLKGSVGIEMAAILYTWADEGDTIIFTISKPEGIEQVLRIFPELANE